MSYGPFASITPADRLRFLARMTSTHGMGSAEPGLFKMPSPKSKKALVPFTSLPVFAIFANCE